MPQLKSSNLLISSPLPSPTYQEDRHGSQRRTCQSLSPCLPACHFCTPSSLQIPQAPQRTSLPSHLQSPAKKSLLHPSLQRLLQTQATKRPLNPLSQIPIKSNISPLLVRQREIPESRRVSAPGSPQHLPSPALQKANFWSPQSLTWISPGHPLTLPWILVPQRTPEPSLRRGC